DLLPVLEQAREDVVDVVDRKGVVRAVNGARPFEPRAPAVPDLLLRIAFAAEKDVLAVRPPGNEHGDGLGLGKMGEVIEVAVGTVRIVHVAVANAYRRRGNDGDAALHVPQQLGTALRVNFHVHAAIMPQSRVGGTPSRAEAEHCYHRLARSQPARAATYRLSRHKESGT